MMDIGDKVTGRVKQAAGALSGDEALRREGAADERRADAKQELTQQQQRADAEQAHADRKAEEVERLEHGGPAPIPDYDRLNADEVGPRLDGLSDAELAEVEAHERRHHDRKTVLDAIASRRR